MILYKAELNSLMEINGAQFVVIQILTLLLQMYSVDLSVQYLVLLVGHIMEIYHTSGEEILLMVINYQFLWTMFCALEMSKV